MHCKERSDLYITGHETAWPRSHFHIHVSVSDLCIPTSSPLILLQTNRQTNPENILIAHRDMNVGFGNEAAQFHFWEVLVSNFRYSFFAVWECGVNRKNVSKK